MSLNCKYEIFRNLNLEVKNYVVIRPFTLSLYLNTEHLIRICVPSPGYYRCNVGRKCRLVTKMREKRLANSRVEVR